MIRKVIFTLLLLIQVMPSYALASHEETSGGIFLNYDDLVQLSQSAKPEGELQEKLEKQLNLPIIVQPSEKKTDFLAGENLGKFFRAASWNIERGFNIDEIERVFLDGESLHSNENLDEQIKSIRKASIIILNEVDLGVPRTNYENIAGRLAKALKMGFVFGPEFIEVDPYQLGVKKFSEEERTFLEDKALKQLDNIEKEKYFGLHGTAILTKYPILNAKIIRLPDCYSWFQEESDKLSAIELVRRGAAKTIFSEKVLTELRHGGRMAIVAELMLPNQKRITVVATHIENRCLPECRLKQFEFLLNKLRGIRNPLILAGDFNTTGTDASPTSAKKEVLKRVKDPEFIARQIILSLTPITLIQNVVLGTVNKLRQFKDPTTRHIPVVLPNKERKLFDFLADFRFTDKKAFDVRGIPEKSFSNSRGLLSNSNERELKGFKPTFELERNLGIAKYKLDWFFIKPLDLKDSNDKEGSYTYAPHFGRTLDLVNRAFGERISDHDPIIVDIPVYEPKY